MPDKKPWTVDPAGNVRAGPKRINWRDVRWGQVLAFGFGGLAFLVAANGSYSHARQEIQIGAILTLVGVALRAIDVWKSKP